MVEIKNLEKISILMKNVTIKEENIPKLFENIHLVNSHWLDNPAYNLEEFSEKELVMFLLLLNSTSFSYWGEPNWKIEYNGEKINGARAMILSLRKAIREGKLKLDPKELINLSREKYRDILKGESEIPLFNERYQIIQEIAKVLIDKFEGDVLKLINKANGDALELVKILIGNFYFFEDYMNYEGEKIFLNKKAQLFVIDLYRLNKKKGINLFKKMNKLTACADYKLPQVLRRYNILEYSEELTNLIDNNIPLPNGSHEEFEIRIKTILAVEKIKNHFKEKLSINVESYQINDLLWLLGQEKHPDDKTYHKVRSIKY